MFKDNKLRLLMTLAGFERIGEPDDVDAAWMIPSSLTSTALRETATLIGKHRMDPIMYWGENGAVQAEELLRRETAPRSSRAEFDDDSEGLGEEDFLFPAGGPTIRKSTALDELKKRRRKRRRSVSEDEDSPDEELIAARRKARLLADIEKRRKIKSTEFVHDSDDEDDEERDRQFFASEDARRQKQASKNDKAMQINDPLYELLGDPLDDVPSRKRKNNAPASKRRKGTKSSDIEEESSGSNSSGEEAGAGLFLEDEPLIRGASSSPAALPDLDISDPSSSNTPPSSQTDDGLQALDKPRGGGRRPSSAATEPALEGTAELGKGLEGIGLEGGGDGDADEDEDSDVGGRRGQRGRAVVVDDSDDE